MHPRTDTRTVASFSSYAEAERAVEYLVEADFPVEHVSIIGRDLQLDERVTGRVSPPGATLRGAGGGAVTGFVIGWVFGWFDWLHPLVASGLLALYGLIFGAIVGALFGLLTWALARGQHEYESVRALRPARYDLLVDAVYADRAMALLERAGLATAAHPAGT
jgi:hypothetical protein